ncbi:Uncharacterised protein [Salmonella enterica subsp. enterica serovar Bovismorbificans]|uniref:Uncharacterized protein n=1 Tax=Salmonella enterica subsp. enterica serovar Bovismorbificans TaxID=58097 RepID=A0A655EGE2_SALET|nr:Uncharacterised protein [Salmonella enterica subsp. enterica serovar Bovismorbificans]
MRILQVGGNHGMFQQKLARGWRMTIPFLGNGQRHNRYLRFAHRRQHTFQTINLDMQRRFDDAHHTRRPGIRRHLRHGIEVILLL